MAGYRTYSGVSSRAYTNMIDVGKTTSATLSSLVNGVTYYFTVTAYDITGLESDFSNEVAYTVPASPIQLKISVAPAGPVLLSGAGITGHTYEVLATTNFTVWTSIGRVTAGAGGSFQFTDPTPRTSNARFFRMRDTQP